MSRKPTRLYGKGLGSMQPGQPTSLLESLLFAMGLRQRPLSYKHVRVQALSGSQSN